MKKSLFFLAMVVIIISLLAGCATPAPEVIEKEVVVTQEVEVEKVVTQVVEKWVYVTPTAESMSSEPVQGGEVTITYYQGFGPGFPDIHQNKWSTGHMIGKQMFDTLLAYDETINASPNLAETWDVSDDGLTYTFNLVQGIHFHNGKELKAEDVVFSLDHARDPNISAHAADLEMIDTVTAVDDYTVQITTKETYAPMLDKLAYPGVVIYPKDLAPTPEEAIGTGPFMMESLVPEQEIVLVRNPDYWKKGDTDAPYIERVKINFIEDEMARFGALMSGVSDIIYTPPHSARETLNNDSNYAVFPGLAHFEGIAISTYNVEAFANPMVREAVNIAISRKDIVDVALDGVGIAILGDIQVPGSWAYNDTEYMPMEGDLEKAKALLEEAGYGDGFSFTLGTWEQWPTEVKSAQLIQERFKELGIDVKIEHVDPGIWVEKVYEGNIDAAFQGLGAPIEPDNDFAMTFHPTRAVVHNLWENQEIADMIDAAAKELDRDQRAQMYRDITAALYAHGEDTYTTFLPLWREPQDIALNVKKVHGYVDDGRLGLLTSLKDMWVTE